MGGKIMGRTGGSWLTQLVSMARISIPFQPVLAPLSRLHRWAGEATVPIALKSQAAWVYWVGVNRKSLKLRLRIGFRYGDLVLSLESFLGLSLEF